MNLDHRRSTTLSISSSIVSQDALSPSKTIVYVTLKTLIIAQNYRLCTFETALYIVR